MSWRESRPANLDELTRELFMHSGRPLAFRGQADATWALQSSLDREQRLPDYEHELGYLSCFADEARRFVSGAERVFIDAFRVNKTSPQVWSVMGLARHYGLWVRALDWTFSAFVGAYFAAIHEHDKDGALWWFNQLELEGILHAHWNHWKVPLRDPADPRSERAIEAVAFSKSCNRAWVTKIHFPIPFPRMEAQQAFLTVCARLGVDQDKALDDLKVRDKGKLIVARALKNDILDYLESLGVSAASLQYPGADIAAAAVNRPKTEH